MNKRILTSLLVGAYVLISCAVGSASSNRAAYLPSVKIATVLKTSVNSLGGPLVYPRTDKPEVTMLSVVIPPGTGTGWHLHPIQGYGYVLSGTLTIRTKNGAHVFHTGEGFAEPVNVLHEGRNLGTEPVKLIVLFAGERGQPYAIKEHAPLTK